MNKETFLQEAKEKESQLIETRHYLHQHAETGFDLTETKAYVKDQLVQM